MIYKYEERVPIIKKKYQEELGFFKQEDIQDIMLSGEKKARYKTVFTA